MKKQVRLNAANMVADALFPTEETVDTTLVQLASLVQSMVTARQEANLKGPVGQDAFDHLGEAFAAQFQVRRSITATHASLKETMTQIGLREYAVGDTDKCIDVMRPSAESGHLSVVA